MNPSTGVRVLVVDDHPAIRRGLRHLLAACKDITVVGEAADGESALSDAHRLQPDIMLLDAHLRDSNGFNVTTRLHAEMPMVRIVMLRDYEPEEHADSACGAHACLLKREVDGCLGETIRAVACVSSAIASCRGCV